MSKAEPLTRQVGGNHYSKLAIQPIEFATINRYDPCAFSILKYITRWRDKNGVQDLHKAKHLAEIRASSPLRLSMPIRWMEHSPIKVSDYNNKNRIGIPEADVLTELHYWVFAGDEQFSHWAHRVIMGLDALIAGAEGVEHG